VEYKWIPYLIGVIFSFLVACTQFLLDFAPYLLIVPGLIESILLQAHRHVMSFNFIFFFGSISEFQLLAV
jgi:hypothetical protein